MDIERRFHRRLRIFVWGFVALAAAATLVMVLFPAATPYALYAIFSAPSNTVVPLYNEPGLLFFAPGSIAWLLALVAMPGVALGGVLDYALIGRALDSPRLDGVREHRWTRLVVRLFARVPGLTIFACALLPAPFWLVRLLAPASGYPLVRYVLAVMPGRFGRYVVVAKLGHVLGVPPEVGLWALALTLLYVVWVLVRAALRVSRRMLRKRAPEPESVHSSTGELSWIIEQAVVDASEPREEHRS